MTKIAMWSHNDKILQDVTTFDHTSVKYHRGVMNLGQSVIIPAHQQFQIIQF